MRKHGIVIFIAVEKKQQNDYRQNIEQIEFETNINMIIDGKPGNYHKYPFCSYPINIQKAKPIESGFFCGN